MKIVLHLFIALVLTVISQIGGIIYLATFLFGKLKKLDWKKTTVLYLGLYLLISLLILPFITPFFGRSALPISGNLKPLNYLTVLLNRHYVDNQMKTELEKISSDFQSEYPNSHVNYLDANFPFIDGFPLFPHLSHNDGKKIDLTFFYLHKDQPINSSPSFLGYGAFDEPKQNEEDYPQICEQKGFWQYSLLRFITVGDKGDYKTDIDRTRRLIQLLAQTSNSKIFLEPHLKKRWKLNRFDNIRFHGCHAVRHDDHIHFQIQ